jgi:hypothetical protein
MRLRDEHVHYMESEALWEEDRKRRIRMFEEQAKRRAAYAVWQKRKEIQRMDVSACLIYSLHFDLLMYHTYLYHLNNIFCKF